MLFSLEALQAEHGDSLILHYGSPKKPRFIVIDGGPKTVYKNALKPRLAELRSRFSHAEDGKLDITMAMISHIDEDHIQGLLDWVDDLAENEVVDNIIDFWFNSFDEVVGNIPSQLKAGTAAFASIASVDGAMLAQLVPGAESTAVVASVQQGRDLRSKLKKLGVRMNRGTAKLLLADGKDIKLEGDLTMRVVCPNQTRLLALYKKWEEHVKAHPGKQDAEAASFADQSVYNLSSLVVVATLGKNRMLLTGDARGDDILDGLERGGLLKAGKAHFDLLKLPHHGSERNVAPKFFEQLTADHYVISANGKFGNPDPGTLEMIAKARGEDKYTVHITNHEGAPGMNLKKTLDAVLDKHPALKTRTVFRAENRKSIIVNLQDPVKH